MENLWSQILINSLFPNEKFSRNKSLWSFHILQWHFYLLCGYLSDNNVVIYVFRSSWYWLLEGPYDRGPDHHVISSRSRPKFVFVFGAENGYLDIFSLVSFSAKMNFNFWFIFRFRLKNLICIGPKMLRFATEPYCDIGTGDFRFRFSAESGISYSSAFSFTAENEKCIFGRPLISSLCTVHRWIGVYFLRYGIGSDVCGGLCGGSKRFRRFLTGFAVWQWTEISTIRTSLLSAGDGSGGDAIK